VAPIFHRVGREARRRLAIAAGIAAATAIVFLLTAPASVLRAHTPYDHFALLAEAWLDGRLDLGGPPPAYTGANDFAVYGDPSLGERVYVSFPPFPAVILLPFVALAGSAEATRDGLVFVLLAGVAPALLFLALGRLRDLGRSRRSERGDVALALLFALGTVYWSSAVQGTVWFAAHVVGAACCAAYVGLALDAGRPFAAGVALALGVATRTPLLFAAPFFVAEAWLRGRREGPGEGAAIAGVALAPLARRLARFAAPLAVVLAALAWHNAVRFDDPFEFGHRHLAVVWQDRIQRWGLFSPHYLGRNLAVALGGTPFWGGPGEAPRIGGHGLALWITSPFYLALLASRPRPAARATFAALAVAAGLVALPALLYQNTGWIQFGYRFSNDVAPMLFVLLAAARPRLGPCFAAAAAAAVVVNGFGAISFQRPGWERWYVTGRDVHAIVEPD
jgi:hypothetical protein